MKIENAQFPKSATSAYAVRVREPGAYAVERPNFAELRRDEDVVRLHRDLSGDPERDAGARAFANFAHAQGKALRRTSSGDLAAFLADGRIRTAIAATRADGAAFAGGAADVRDLALLARRSAPISPPSVGVKRRSGAIV